MVWYATCWRCSKFFWSLVMQSFVWLLLFKSMPSAIIVIHLDCVNRNINYIHEQLKQYISSKSYNSPWVPNVKMMNSVTGSSAFLKVLTNPPSLTDIRQQYKRITNHFDTMNDILLTPLGFSHILCWTLAIYSLSYSLFYNTTKILPVSLKSIVTSSSISAVSWLVQAHMADRVAQQASEF